MPSSALFAAVNHAAPKETLWVTEAGSNETAIAACVRGRVVGAQLAAPDRPVVALMGDGSIQYAITALWSAVAYKIPVTIVVASNREYGVLTTKSSR
jgi:benzoylformate decarboxylase